MSVSFVERLVQAGQLLSSPGKIYRVLAGQDDTDRAQPIRAGYDGSVRVSPGDAAADAFGRLRSSTARQLFENKQLFDKETFFYVEQLSGTATSNFVPNNAAVRMQVLANGDKVTRQTRYYFPYVPGQSQLIMATGVLAEQNDANVFQRIGYFDDSNGAFFQNNDGNLSVVLRSFTSGSVTPTTIPQASWNLDPLDGSGPSGITLNPARANIYVIDLAWLGVGSVRMGVQFGGRVIYCHEFANENSNTTVYMSTPSLPVRYEIEATGVPGAPAGMLHICSAVYSEGTSQPLGLVLSANMGTTVSSPLGAGTPTPICSLRAQNNRERVTLRPLDASVRISANEDFLIQVFVGGTTTGGTFNAVNGSNAEFNSGVSSLTGGLCVGSKYVPGSGVSAEDLDFALDSTVALGANVDGSIRDEITIVVTAFTGTPTISAGLTWKELT